MEETTKEWNGGVCRTVANLYINTIMAMIKKHKTTPQELPQVIEPWKLRVLGELVYDKCITVHDARTVIKNMFQEYVDGRQ